MSDIDDKASPPSNAMETKETNTTFQDNNHQDAQHPSATQPAPFTVETNSWIHATQQNVVVVQQPPIAVVAHVPPPDYTLVSIGVCLCCFWPTGLLAIYFAMQAKSQFRACNYEDARTASDNVISTIVAVVWIIVVIIAQAIVSVHR